MPQDYTKSRQVLDHIQNLIDTNKGSLGLAYVSYGEEELLPIYPAAVVTAGPETRAIHTTQMFLVEFAVDIWVYHGRMDQTHKVRTQTDLDLADAVRTLLHDNYTLGGHIIFGYVSSSIPGVIATNKSEFVIGTRMTWTGQNRELF